MSSATLGDKTYWVSVFKQVEILTLFIRFEIINLIIGLLCNTWIVNSIEQIGEPHGNYYLQPVKRKIFTVLLEALNYIPYYTPRSNNRNHPH